MTTVLVKDGALARFQGAVAKATRNCEAECGCSDCAPGDSCGEWDPDLVNCCTECPSSYIISCNVSGTLFDLGVGCSCGVNSITSVAEQTLCPDDCVYLSTFLIGSGDCVAIGDQGTAIFCLNIDDVPHWVVDVVFSYECDGFGSGGIVDMIYIKKRCEGEICPSLGEYLFHEFGVLHSVGSGTIIDPGTVGLA